MRPKGSAKTPGSGRVKGTPNKVTQDIRAAAQVYTAQALETLARIMTSGRVEASRVAACKELLDRAYGKAPQALTGADGGALSVLTRIVHEHQPAVVPPLPDGPEPAALLPPVPSEP